MSVTPDILHNARLLRETQTDTEQFMWQLLRNRRFCGVKFRRQHPVGRYILDFYCHDAQLAIELDGGGHAEDRQQEYDTERSAELAGAGIRVLRFWNHEVLQETEAVVTVLFNALFPVRLK